MTSEAIESRTFLPEARDALAPVLSFLSAHELRRGEVAEPRYALVGIGEHERIAVPRSVHQALVQVVTALQAGRAVTVAPQSMTLTTQQVADLLGVSRPTVVRLIRAGELPAERVGNRHRLLLDDVLAYRDARRHRQYEALAATGADISADDDPVTVREQLRQVRRAVAARRRAE